LLSLLVNAAGQMGTASGPAGVPEANSPPSAPSTLPLPAFAAIGSSFAEASQLAELGWTEAQMAAFIDGVNAALHGKAYAMDDTARAVSAEMARRLQQIEERRKQQTAAQFAQPDGLAKYLKVMRKRYQMEVTDSGLVYSIQPGAAGVRPRPGDTVVISIVATAADGTTKLPQLSRDHLRVKLDNQNLLPGFLEGLQMMTLESHAKFILPPALSFGDGEWPPGVDKGTPLLFVVTLHEVISAEAAPATPP